MKVRKFPLLVGNTACLNAVRKDTEGIKYLMMLEN